LVWFISAFCFLEIVELVKLGYLLGAQIKDTKLCRTSGDGKGILYLPYVEEIYLSIYDNGFAHIISFNLIDECCGILIV